MKKVTISVMFSIAVLVLAAGCSLLRPHASTSADVPSTKGVVSATLSNGLKVLIVPNTMSAAVTSVLSYHAGSAQAPKGEAVVAHALQHLVFSGEGTVGQGEYDAVARNLGGNLSGETTANRTRFIFTVPAAQLAEALHLQSLSMKGITNRAADWRAVRAGLKIEIGADLTNPQYVLFSRLRSDLFRGTPYAPDGLGSQAALKGVTFAELKRFHDRWYLPNNASLVIAGDVAPKAALAAARSAFGSVPHGTLPSRASLAPVHVVPESLDLSGHLAYGSAAIALQFPGYRSPDYPAALVLAQIVRSAPKALDSLVSTGAVFGAGFTYDAFRKTGMATLIAAYSPQENASTIKERLKLILARYMNGGIPAAEVTAAKLRTELNLESRLDGVTGLALGWGDALAEGDSTPQQLLHRIAAVSPAAVNRAAVRYIDLGKAEFATSTPAKGGATVPLSSQGYGGPEQIDLTSTASAALPSWAKTQGKYRTAQPHLSDTHLANGLRLIVVPETNSGIVELYGLVDSNPYVQVPKGQEGVNEVLDQLMNDGTSSLDRAAFDRRLSAIGARETGGTSFTLSVMQNNLSAGVKLLAENLLHPALSTANFKQEQKLIGQLAAARAQNPSVKAREAFLKAVLPKGDPARRRTTVAEVDGLTLKEVKAYYRAVFRPDMTTIVVIGDVTAKRAASVISHSFGRWGNQGAKPDILLPSGVPNRSSTVVVKDPGSSFDQVRMAETIPMVRSNPDYYALQLGNELLSGGIAPGLLSTALTAHHLPVSYLSASYIAGLSRAFYLIDFSEQPAQVQSAAMAIEQALTRLQHTPASPERFDRARRELLQSLALSETGYSSIANALLNRARLRLPLDEAKRAAAAYAQLTPKTVSAALARWVRPKDFALVVQGPAPPKPGK